LTHTDEIAGRIEIIGLCVLGLSNVIHLIIKLTL